MSDQLHDEQNLGRVYDHELVARLVPFLKPHKKLGFIAAALVLLQVLVEVAQPWLAKLAIDGPVSALATDANSEGAWQALTWLALGIVGLLVVELFLRFFSDFSLTVLGQKVIFDLRSKLYRHLQELPLRFYDRNPVGRLVTRTTSDMESIGEFFSSGLVRIASDLLKIAAILIIMLSMNWQLALAMILFFPIMFGVTSVFRVRARNAFRIMRLKQASLNSFLNESIGGMAVTRIFAQEEKQRRRYDEHNREYRKAALETVLNFSLFFPAVQLVSTAASLVLLWYGVQLVTEQTIGAGTLVAFFFYTEMLFRPIREISERYTILQSAMASTERVFALLDEKNEVLDPPQPIPFDPEAFRGRIEFRNVWFAYVGQEWVLKDVSFVLEPGEALALVGATGSGKTTIISLLCRFYDIQRGEILVDGVDIRQMRKHDLRGLVGMVLQDVFLFAGSVMENLRLGDESISRKKVEEAARTVGAESFIQKLEGGFDAPVAERGATFSTGQKQLIAFARTLAFDPRILILDEATANIDSETEALIQQALQRLMQGRTSVAVAHRLSTIRNANQILVLHKGEIVESGTHEELLARRGRYWRLYTLQFEEAA